MSIGMAQRDVPAHWAHEYCRPDRSFDPLPSFREKTLPRILTFETYLTDIRSWFPLSASDSGLGFDFVGRLRWFAVRALLAQGGDVGPARLELAAVSLLDKVRTDELTLSREHLNPPALSQSMSV